MAVHLTEEQFRALPSFTQRWLRLFNILEPALGRAEAAEMALKVVDAELRVYMGASK